MAKASHFWRLRKLVVYLKIQMLVVFEMHIHMSLAEEFRVRLNFDFVISHSNGLLWVFYNNPVVCSIVGEGAQFLSLFIQHPYLVSPVSFTTVHAATTVEERKALWAGLLQYKLSHDPWLVCGDFNVVVGEEEKKGGKPFTVVEAADFVAFMGSAGLVDGGFSGSSFTWCNNHQGRPRIWKCLDRLLLNVECFDASLSFGVTHLGRHPSDHAPLLISTATRVDGKPRPFHFINAWTDHEDFLGVVKESWQQECVRSPMQVLCSKLQRLKRHLQLWNKDRVGKFSDNVKKVEEELGKLERCLEEGGFEDAHLELQQVQVALRRALAMEESLWKQRSRIKWLALGDCNTKFFHSVVKQRRMQSVIHRIKNCNGEWVNEDALIGAEAVRYFSSLFSLEDTPAMMDVPDVIPRLVSLEDDVQLEAVPPLEEVRQTVFEMDVNSAAGPDSFTGKLFSFAWEIVGGDVYNDVQSFFCGAELLRRIIATSIVLLSKVHQQKDFSQFRAISLCNFVNKIFSKILARRLAPILPKIISVNQSGFVQGRSISNNYLLA
ncbi:uncharacterized protein LOC113759893 [Coffea eugenioides]|uniref:uncharacterized protein LOC113759893 n=1 Tax=Coffea eugenioides TaxID=49369 RepID=UPI000F60665C|nr:uncharacterized protein LOC113759893 [Coffea eugenioides]